MSCHPALSRVIAALERAEREFLLLAAPDGTVAVNIEDLRTVVNDLQSIPELGWLIERDTVSGLPQYLSSEGWSSDHMAAIRFARRQDAEDCAAFIGIEFDRVADHMWLRDAMNNLAANKRDLTITQEQGQ